MRRLLLVAAGLSALAAWLLLAPLGRSPDPVLSTEAPRTPRTMRPTQPLRRAVEPVQPTKWSEAAQKKIDKLGTRLYARAADCYHGGLPADRRLDLEYRVRVTSGEIAVSEARVTDSTLGDQALERCIVERVLSFRDRDPSLPDHETADDLYIRVGGFKPYLARVGSDGDDPL